MIQFIYIHLFKETINQFLIKKGYSENNIYHLISNKNVLIKTDYLNIGDTIVYPEFIELFICKNGDKYEEIHTYKDFKNSNYFLSIIIYLFQNSQIKKLLDRVVKKWSTIIFCEFAE